MRGLFTFPVPYPPLVGLAAVPPDAQPVLESDACHPAVAPPPVDIAFFPQCPVAFPALVHLCGKCGMHSVLTVPSFAAAVQLLGQCLAAVWQHAVCILAAYGIPGCGRLFVPLGLSEGHPPVPTKRAMPGRLKVMLSIRLCRRFGCLVCLFVAGNA